VIVRQDTADVDLAWTRGDTVGFSFRLKTLSNLAGNTWKAEIREAQSRKSQLLDSFLVSATADVDDCVVAVGLPPTSPLEVGQFWWDLQSDDGAAGIQTWIGGRVFVQADVTDA
jgi:hypothetical protein